MMPLYRNMKRAAKRLFRRAPVTCAEAGAMGAAVRREMGREPIRAKARGMCSELGMAVPDALQPGGEA